jgi:hypothetical protein
MFHHSYTPPVAFLTRGAASAAPLALRSHDTFTRADDSVFDPARPAAVDVVVRDGARYGGSRLTSLAEAIAMMATLPLAILIAGAPVVAAVWMISYAVAWLTGSG